MEIKADEIYSFKLTCGQEVVAKVLEIAEEGYHLDAPLTIGQGQNGMEFLPVMFTAEFGTKGLLHYIGVALALPCREDVKEAYIESVKPQEEKSGIITPGPKQIITG